jgi:hypothetical protein
MNKNREGDGTVLSKEVHVLRVEAAYSEELTEQYEL